MISISCPVCRTSFKSEIEVEIKKNSITLGKLFCPCCGIASSVWRMLSPKQINEIETQAYEYIKSTVQDVINGKTARNNNSLKFTISNRSEIINPSELISNCCKTEWEIDSSLLKKYMTCPGCGEFMSYGGPILKEE